MKKYSLKLKIYNRTFTTLLGIEVLQFTENVLKHGLFLRNPGKIS